jgi:hypothetical protein
MLPGYVAGYYSYEECHVDLAKLTSFARARLIVATATSIDAQVSVQGHVQRVLQNISCSSWMVDSVHLLHVCLTSQFSLPSAVKASAAEGPPATCLRRVVHQCWHHARSHSSARRPGVCNACQANCEVTQHCAALLGACCTSLASGNCRGMCMYLTTPLASVQAGRAVQAAAGAGAGGQGERWAAAHRCGGRRRGRRGAHARACAPPAHRAGRPPPPGRRAPSHHVRRATACCVTSSEPAGDPFWQASC